MSGSPVCTVKEGRRWLTCPECGDVLCVTPTDIDQPLTLSDGKTLTAEEHRAGYDKVAAEAFEQHKIQDHILSPINRALRQRFGERFEFTGTLDHEDGKPAARCYLRAWEEHRGEGWTKSTRNVSSTRFTDVRAPTDFDKTLDMMLKSITGYEERRAREVAT